MHIRDWKKIKSSVLYLMINLYLKCTWGLNEYFKIQRELERGKDTA